VRSSHVRRGSASAERREDYSILFDDGRVERLGFTADSSGETLRRCAEFVCARTGKPLRVVKFPDEVKAIATGEESR
jgi:hypothetical protein